ncbi:hypothetical protein MPSEU_000147000 [Mayamaea pseudoterrestris]|nr:hypothetical protein MPSEU_000147000 [Mayamaea pseudoterrestris]
MAGTRLYLQALFISQFVVLVIAAFYLGLWNDLVSRHLFGSRDARWLLRGKNLSSTSIAALPPVTFISADSQIGFWNNYLKETRRDDDIIQVKSHPDLQSVCQNPTKPTVSDADVWICESVPPPTEMKMVIVNASTVLYSRGLRQRKNDMQQLYPSETMERRNLEVTIHAPTRDDLSVYKASFRQWVEEKRIMDWPCVRDVIVKAKLFDLSSLAIEPVFPDGEIDPFIFSLANMTADTFECDRRSNDSFCLSLFIPSQSSKICNDTSHRQFQRRYHLVSIFSNHATTGSTLQHIDDALGAPLETLLGQWMGMPPNMTDFVKFESIDYSFPQWYTKLWFHRMLARRFREIHNKLEEQRSNLLNATSTIHVSETMVAHWLDLAERLRQSHTMAAQGLYYDAMDEVEALHDELTSLHNHPDLVEPHDFPKDQYSAIFAPLLFPLLLPLLIGLRRELKRRKQLSLEKVKKA